MNNTGEIQRIYILDNDCPHCKFLKELFGNLKNGTTREYWIMTEMMVYLHGGSDVCNYGTDIETVFNNLK